jgi:hypothetical protein
MIFLIVAIYLGFQLLGDVAKWVGVGLLVGWTGLSFIPAMRPFTMAPLALILGPIITVGMRFRAEPTVEAVETLPASASEAMRDSFKLGRASFEAAGLTPCGVWRISSTDLIQAYSAAFEKPGEPFIALVVAMIVKNSRDRRRAYMTIYSIGADGSDIVTNNNPNPPILPLRGARIHLPDVSDASALLRVHSAMMDRYQGEGRARSPRATEWSAWFLENERAEYARWLQRGWVVPAEKAGEVRFSFATSTLIAWKTAWPMEAIRRRLQARASRRLRRKLGV